jgi:hypothetical protein
MPRTISYTSNQLNVFVEILHTLAQLRAYPITAPFVLGFTALKDRWAEVNTEELGLIDAEVTANAHASRVDDDIDPLVDRLARLILDAIKGNRADPLYRRYFARKRPSDVKRPILGVELDEVRGWIPSLLESELPGLVALGELLRTLVDEADHAVGEQADVARRWDDYVKLGNWRKLIDDLNTQRQDLHADLTKLKNTPEGQDLPADFADRFFLHATRSRKRQDVPTVASTKVHIAGLEKELAEQQALLAKLEEEERLQKEAEAQRNADEAAMGELERQLAEVKARLGQ